MFSINILHDMNANSFQNQNVKNNYLMIEALHNTLAMLYSML